MHTPHHFIIKYAQPFSAVYGSLIMVMAFIARIFFYIFQTPFTPTSGLGKDNTWTVSRSLAKKQRLMHKGLCGQFVSTAFCKMAVERFMKVEKLGLTTVAGKSRMNSFAVINLTPQRQLHM